jgi:hypothetical protein
MPTNKIVLREVDQFMSDYVPIYQPIYPLFLGGKSQSYTREIGKLDFRRIQTVGDIRAKHITPKDTEIRQISVMEGKKSFKKYFLANQFTLSDFEDRQGVEEVVAQVLDEHQLQSDELLLLGEGTSGSDVLNNGLYYSADANFTLESSVEIALTDRLYSFHNLVTATANKANQVAGRKVIFFYGTLVLPLVNSVYPTAVRAWKAALLEVLGPNYSIVEIPAASTPSGANGWIIANMDQCKLHYTVLPELMNQGQNEEKMYLWFNFLMGSMMLEVLANDGIIRQPATLGV